MEYLILFLFICVTFLTIVCYILNETLRKVIKELEQEQEFNDNQYKLNNMIVSKIKEIDEHRVLYWGMKGEA